jgi:hypothetical protein
MLGDVPHKDPRFCPLLLGGILFFIGNTWERL